MYFFFQKNQNKKYSLGFVLAVFFLFSLREFAFGYVMSSGSYRMQSDSLNIAGQKQDSADYLMQESVGEIEAQEGRSNSYKMYSGWEATWEYPPGISFEITDYTAELGTLSTAVASTGTLGFSISSNGIDGYAVTITGDTLTSNSSGNDIDAISAIAPSSPGSEQFGINLVANTDPMIGSNPSGGTGQAASGYNQQNNFKFVSGNTIATADNFSGTTEFTISCLANINNQTVSSDYSTNITLIATAVF